MRLKVMQFVAGGLACALGAWHGLLLAQVAPDSGSTLQQLMPAPSAPPPSPDIDIQSPAVSSPVAPGGPSIRLTGIRFDGNTAFSAAQLALAAGDIASASYDMAALRGLTDAITDFYRRNGYPFARAFLPPQTLQDGALQITVIEGRYGKVTATSQDARLALQAQSFLDALQPNEVIQSESLARATLILSDQPGIAISPVMRPGQAAGTGDLDVAVSRTKPFAADVAIDNHGNYYSGQRRVVAGLSINSPFMLGDQLSLRAIYTQERLWMGSANYSAPLGSSGLRGNLGYAQTHYELANGFEGNDGIARIASAGLSYPLVRAQAHNLTLGAAWQAKRLYNSYFYGANTDRYRAWTVPLTLSFDRRWAFLGGGLTYGALTWTHGNLNKNDPVREGRFRKVNLDVMHLQALPVRNLTLYLRFSRQWASRNLDSSEAMLLGGANGVRAYPTGEASGDEGWLAQVELRYQAGALAPYVFYDQGKVKVNARPSQVLMPSPDLWRAGAGAGVRATYGSWHLDGAIAWRTRGGAPVSDTHSDPRPRIWLTAGYRF